MTGFLAAFVRDPVGTLRPMRATAPKAHHAALALIAATLVHVVIDYIYGAFAWPHSFEEGGRRSYGPFLGAFRSVVRIFAVAAMLWLGGCLILKQIVTGAQAMWLTLPYALSHICLDVLEIATVILFVLTGIDAYGGLFFIGYSATILVLVVCVRALYDGVDWLRSLGVAIPALIGGMFVAPLVVLATGFFLLKRRFL